MFYVANSADILGRIGEGRAGAGAGGIRNVPGKPSLTLADHLAHSS